MLLVWVNLLRSVPELHFEYDSSVEHGRHLSDLIERAVARSPVDDDDETGH